MTARRRLKGAGLRNHSAVQKPILTPLHKELRLIVLFSKISLHNVKSYSM
jgi:hypothetical protein